jgi:hypothetical protein
MSAIIVPFGQALVRTVPISAAPSVSPTELRAAQQWAARQGEGWHVEAIRLADAEIALGISPPRCRPRLPSQKPQLPWIIVRDAEGAVLIHAENSSGVVLSSVMAALEAVQVLEIGTVQAASA